MPILHGWQSLRRSKYFPSLDRGRERQAQERALKPGEPAIRGEANVIQFFDRRSFWQRVSLWRDDRHVFDIVAWFYLAPAACVSRNGLAGAGSRDGNRGGRRQARQDVVRPGRFPASNIRERLRYCAAI